MGADTSRLQRTRVAVEGANLDGLLVTHLPNVFYLSGFTGSNAALIVLPDSLHLFTDGRYTIQAGEECPGSRVHIVRGPLADACGKFLAAGRRPRGKGREFTKIRVGFDPVHVNVSEWTRLQKAAGSQIRWKPAAGLVESLREVKDVDELKIMREAAKLGSEVMTEVIGLVRPGVSELELAAEIDYRMRRKGAQGTSFESIVASGPRSALPHARPTAKRVQKGELVVLDLGAILRSYCSDLTRTVHVGKASSKVCNWYRAVEDAQKAALDALKAGVTAGSVDRAARRTLERSGLARYFVHSTGHGLGIEVHETPRLGKGQMQKIVVGSVVTLEPGIYLEGAGGIRIEDDVAVLSTGPEVITSAPRGFVEI